MRLSVHRSLPVAGAFLLASTLLAGCEVNLNTEGLSARETKSFKVAGLPEIDLDTFDGAIEIHSWDKAEVEIEVEKRAMEQSLIDQIKVEATQQGNKIVLKVTGPSRTETDDGSIGFEGRPPVLHLKTGDGSVRAQIDVDTVMAENWDIGIHAGLTSHPASCEHQHIVIAMFNRACCCCCCGASASAPRSVHMNVIP